jgi:NitT/TauT family transport system permease protein
MTAATVGVRPARQRGGARRRWLTTGQRVLVVAILVGIWELLSVTNTVSPQTLPAPWPVLDQAFNLIKTSQTQHNLAVTMEQVLYALVIALAAGSALGIVAWRYLPFRSAVYPWLTVANAVPGLLFYPVTIVLIGLGAGSTVTLASLLGTFTVSELMLAGLRDVRPVYLEVARSMEAGRLDLLRKVALPASFTVLASALRVTFTIVFITVVATQYIQSGQGIGYELRFAYESFLTNEVYGLVLIIMVTSLLAQTVLMLALSRLRGRRDSAGSTTALEQARI